MWSVENLSDKDLLNLIAQGNEHAFTWFYQKHWEGLYQAAYRMLDDEELSKDLIQEVFVGIWEQSYSGADQPKAYLYQVVKNKVLMHLRKGKIASKHLETIKELVSNTTEDIIYYAELKLTLSESVNGLPQKCQEVYKLSREDHLSNQEIANRLGISIRTVETHISHALKQIRGSLDTSAALIAFFLSTSFY